MKSLAELVTPIHDFDCVDFRGRRGKINEIIIWYNSGKDWKCWYTILQNMQQNIYCFEKSTIAYLFLWKQIQPCPVFV